MKLNIWAGALLSGALLASSLAPVEAQTTTTPTSVQVFTATTSGGVAANSPNDLLFTLLVGQNAGSFALNSSFVFQSQNPGLFVQTVNSIWVANASGQPIAILCGPNPPLRTSIPGALGTPLVPVTVDPSILAIDNSGTACPPPDQNAGLFSVFANNVAFANNIVGSELAQQLQGAHLVVTVTKNTGQTFEYDPPILENDPLECPDQPKPPVNPPKPPVNPPKPPVNPPKPPVNPPKPPYGGSGSSY